LTFKQLQTKCQTEHHLICGTTLEKGNHFKWIRDEENHSAAITEEQYGWLMQGLKIDQKRSIEAVSKKYA